ncbi:MAG: helix-turn-helix transcriptional regulator [Candidatus Omnitrophota bacterium]
MTLGDRIRQIRCRAGLSQKEIAQKSGITISFLSQVERNIAIPSLKSLKNIAFAIDTSISYLLGEDAMISKRIELINKNTKEKIIIENGDNIYLNLV